MEGLVNALGPDDPITLTAIFNLARIFLHDGNLSKSHEMLVSVVRKRKKFFGANHPDTLMTRNELGMSYRVKHQMEIAERLVTNVLNLRKKHLGEEHTYTLWSVNDLSKILCDRKQPERVVLMLEEIIPVFQRTLGEEHVGMYFTKSNLSRAYALCQRWNDADTHLDHLTTHALTRNGHMPCLVISILESSLVVWKKQWGIASRC